MQLPRGATSDGHWPAYLALVGTYSTCVASYKCAPKSALPGAWARLPPSRRRPRPHISGLCVLLVPGPEPAPAQRDGSRPTASLCFAGRGRSRTAAGHNVFGSRSRLEFSVAPDSRHHSLTYNALVGTYLISFAFSTHFTAFGAWVRTIDNYLAGRLLSVWAVRLTSYGPSATLQHKKRYFGGTLRYHAIA